MAMSTSHTRRMILPRVDHGVDWGAERVVLVQHEDGRMLIWRKSCRSWSNRLVGYVHFPGELMLYRHDAPHEYTILHQEGGRLSKALIDRHSKRINAFFEAPVSKIVDIRTTLVLGNKPESTKE